jgi:hypothetical protein
MDILSDVGLPCDKAILFGRTIKEKSCRVSIHGSSWPIFRKATSVFSIPLKTLQFNRNGCASIYFIFETTRRI